MTRDNSVTFRLNETIKAFLQVLARQERRTLSSYIEFILEKHIDDLAPERKKSVLEALVHSPEPDPGEGQQATFSSLMKQAGLDDVADRFAALSAAALQAHQVPSMVTPSDEQPRRKIGKKCKAPAMVVVSVPGAIKRK
jgi:hypothetical protein